MPKKIGQFCATFITGIFITSTSIATPGVTDAGQYSNTCEQQTCQVGYHLGQDTSSTLPQSAVECATGTDLCYSSNYAGNMASNNRKTSCTSCPSGYMLEEVSGVSTYQRDCRVTYYICVAEPEDPLDGCPSNCKSILWAEDSNQPGRQKRCDTSTKKCVYQCKPNYYNASPTSTGTYCKLCPDNLVDDNCMFYGNLKHSELCCATGYYINKELISNTGSGIFTLSYYDVTCNRCPRINNIYGTTKTNICPVITGEGSSITYCYIPEGTNIIDTSGRYQFTQDCHYTTN